MKREEEELVVVQSNPLPTLVDSQLKIEKQRVALQVRLSHLKRDNRTDLETQELLTEVQALEDWIDGRVAKLIQLHPAYHWFSRILGIGNENIGKVVGLIDIEKAPHVSSLWKYCGMHVEPNGMAPKRVPGQKLQYNSQLRSMCWRVGTSLLRARGREGPGKFALYYYQEKEKYTIKYSQAPYKIVTAEQLPRIGGKKVEGMKDGIHYISEGHIHNMSMRKMVKMFLAMLWVVWRQEEGLPVSDPYPVSHLGHTHIRTPEEFYDRPLKVRKVAAVVS